jgi:AcrR family transcriptional regulator
MPLYSDTRHETVVTVDVVRRAVASAPPQRQQPDHRRPGSAEPGRRERKKQETRAALEAAALRLFAERGYEQTTVEDIAEEADVAVRTFFRYFSSKQHVLFGDVAHNIVERLRAALAARPADEPALQAVRAAMDSIDMDDPPRQRQILERMRLLQQMPELLPTYEMVFHELHVVLAEYVAARSGRPVSDLYPQLVAGAATASARAALSVLEAHPDRTESLRRLRHDGFTALTAGLDRLGQVPSGPRR